MLLDILLKNTENDCLKRTDIFVKASYRHAYNVSVLNYTIRNVLNLVYFLDLLLQLK